MELLNKTKFYGISWIATKRVT